MKIKTMYVADDGTSFNTEKECIDYEEFTNKNQYIVYYEDRVVDSFSLAFDDVSSAKRHIAELLHICHKNKIVGSFKLVYRGITVKFNSDELSKFVPAHYNIDGDKLNKLFQLSITKNVKIPGYTLHGDYYLADRLILNLSWREACEMVKTITLPKGKKVIAHTLSKEELETIPEKERAIHLCWYWTCTPYDNDTALYVCGNGSFVNININNRDVVGGARLGFKNPFIN